MGDIKLNEVELEPQADVARLLICSDLRKNIILSLNHGATTLAELREATGASSTAAIHALRELEKQSLTLQDGGRNYLLSSSGKIVALHLESFVQTVDVITQFGQFWLGHDLSGIPDDSLKSIGVLHESQLLSSTPTDVFKAFSTFVKLLEKAKVIRGVFPIFTPDLLHTFGDLAAKGIQIELVVTKEVRDTILELMDHSDLKNVLKKNLKLYVVEKNPKTTVTVTDYFFMLGLFRFDGSYDYSDELLSYNQQGMEWGRGLFNHYLKESKVFDFRD
ncbi:MAG: helix-turn-helix transcriptional regulator [Halobacteriota archaeon]